MDGVIPRRVSQIGSYEPVCVPLVLNWEAVQDHVRPCSGVTEALVTPQVRLIYKVGLIAKCTQPWNKQNQILSVLISRHGAQVFSVRTLGGWRGKSEHSF